MRLSATSERAQRENMKVEPNKGTFQIPLKREKRTVIMSPVKFR